MVSIDKIFILFPPFATNFCGVDIFQWQQIGRDKLLLYERFHTRSGVVSLLLGMKVAAVGINVQKISTLARVRFSPGPAFRGNRGGNEEGRGVGFLCVARHC